MKTIQAGIYMIKNLVDGKVYIGLTKKENFDFRWGAHLKALKKNGHGNEHLQRAWNKHGETNFQFLEIESGTYEDGEIGEREKYWVSYYKSNDDRYGYNKTSGGEAGYTLSEATKRKISEKSKIQEMLMTEEQRKTKGKKISKSLTGRKLSDINKKRIGEANKGRVFSPEIRKRFGAKNKGKKLTNEHVIKRSLSQMTFSIERVLEIYKRIESGEKQINLAREFNVDRMLIGRIKNKIGIYEYIINEHYRRRV